MGYPRYGKYLDRASSLVSMYPYTVTQTNRQIRMAVIVEIPGRTSEAAPIQANSHLLGHIREASIAQTAQQSARALHRAAHQKKIRLAIPIVVEPAGAGARSDFDAASTCTPRHKRIRFRSKSHWNRRRHIDNFTQRQLRK